MADKCTICQNDIADIPLGIQSFLVEKRNAWLTAQNMARAEPTSQYDFGIGPDQQQAYEDFFQQNTAAKSQLVAELKAEFGETYPDDVYKHIVDNWIENPEATGITIRANCSANHQLHLSCARQALAVANVPRGRAGLSVFAQQRELACPMCRTGDAQIQVPVQVDGDTQFVPLPSSAVFNEMYHSQDWRKAPIGPYGFRPLDIVLYIPNVSEIHFAKKEVERMRAAGVPEAQIPVVTLYVGRVVDYALTDAKSAPRKQWRHIARSDRITGQDVDAIVAAPPQYVLIERLAVERGIPEEHNLEIVPVDLVFPFNKAPPTQDEIRASSEIFMQAQDANLISETIRTMYTTKAVSLRDVIGTFQTTVAELRARGYLEPNTLNPTDKINIPPARIPREDAKFLMDYRQLLTYMRNYISATAAEQPLVKEFVDQVYGPDASGDSGIFRKLYSEILGLPHNLLEEINITNLSADQEHAKRIVRCGNAIYYTTQMLLRDAGESPDIVPDINSAILFLLAGLHNIKLDSRNKLFLYMGQAFDRLPSCTTQSSNLRKPELVSAFSDANVFDPTVVTNVAHLEAQPAIQNSDFLRIARTLPAFVEPISIDREIDEQAILMIRCTKRIYKLLLEMGHVSQNGFMSILAYFWSMWKNHEAVVLPNGAQTSDPFIPMDVFQATEAKQQPATNFFNLLDRNLRTHCFESLDSRTIAMGDRVRETMRTRVAAGRAYPTLEQVRNSEAFNNFTNAYAIQIAAVFAEPQALAVGSIALPSGIEESRKRFEQLGMKPVPPKLPPTEAEQLTQIAVEGGQSRVKQAEAIFAGKQAAVAAEAQKAAMAQPPSVREAFLLELSRTLQQRAADIAAAQSRTQPQVQPQVQPQPPPQPSTLLGKRVRGEDEPEGEAEEDDGGPSVPRSAPAKRGKIMPELPAPAPARTSAPTPASAPEPASTVAQTQVPQNIQRRYDELMAYPANQQAGVPPAILLPVLQRIYQLQPFAQYASTSIVDIDNDTISSILVSLPPTISAILAGMQPATPGQSGDIVSWDGRTLSINKFRQQMTSLYLPYLVSIAFWLRQQRKIPLPPTNTEGFYNENPVPHPPHHNIDRAAYNIAVAIVAYRRYDENNQSAINTLPGDTLTQLLAKSQEELQQLFYGSTGST